MTRPDFHRPPTPDDRPRFSGGILFDLFLIVVLAGLAAAGWFAWRRGGIPRSLSSFLPAAPTTLSAGPPPVPDIDVSDRSAWIQGKVRDLLVAGGAGEKHVLGTSTAERQEGGIRWLESILTVRRPPAFDDGKFLSALGPLLAEKGLVLMDDRREGTRRTLEIGDRKRVYQKLIFQ